MPHRIIWSWYTGRWWVTSWVGCYIWYSEKGTGRDRCPPSPFFAEPNVTAHPSTASVPMTVLLDNGPLLCGFNIPLKTANPGLHDDAVRLSFSLFVCLFVHLFVSRLCCIGCSIYFRLPEKTFPWNLIIYGCGDGSLLASINAPHLFLAGSCQFLSACFIYTVVQKIGFLL